MTSMNKAEQSQNVAEETMQPGGHFFIMESMVWHKVFIHLFFHPSDKLSPKGKGPYFTLHLDFISETEYISINRP